jgi:hypothetical protein
MYSRIIITILSVALVGALGFSSYLYFNSGENNPKEAEQVTESTIDAVARHLILPSGEEPTVATVTNLEELAGQPFFKNAKVGHRVLIYTNAKKAILYDPVVDRIVEVAPLTIDSAAGGEESNVISI